ncbi:MAG: F0F1 ATP synthase subunit B [Gemmatimonadota bacterium]|jgi:F-type H+-transporting ATPase subunit b|nr:F0F1 ATP synthase subunit B [Gemmatimonadota bacterium]MDQ8147754.1 F0F1 ATP synthase subunit B [Gemmatimonadota bacterium]MDQ8149666.1 F0F1 ATP synthase subunit B [Gemmatimonadota bacterium]MDQ8156915.1 F0F1 ATP synthase subunit B [Gemmatimonadota bacterium]MDQ8177506.1 F0F1 ATP synthase subunit B [Gemmatimonadota bacterium]
MRAPLSALVLLAAAATPALASSEAEAAAKPGLLDPHLGLMTWTIIVFVLLMIGLKTFAFGPILEAVSGREQAIRDAIAAAERDRAEAAKLIAEQKAAIEAARGEAQRYIAEGRATAEQMRNELLEQARKQQAEMIDNAHKSIEAEKAKAIAELRREAVDLALAGAGKLIGQKLDAAADRQLVEQYLTSLGGK